MKYFMIITTLLFLISISSCTSQQFLNMKGKNSIEKENLDTSMMSQCNQLEWVRENIRTQGGGYIWYLGMSAAVDEKKAFANAEGQALDRLMKECQSIPLAAKFHERCSETKSNGNIAVVRISTSDRDCKSVNNENSDMPRNQILLEQYRNYKKQNTKKIISFPFECNKENMEDCHHHGKMLVMAGDSALAKAFFQRACFYDYKEACKLLQDSHYLTSNLQYLVTDAPEVKRPIWIDDPDLWSITSNAAPDKIYIVTKSEGQDRSLAFTSLKKNFLYEVSFILSKRLDNSYTPRKTYSDYKKRLFKISEILATDGIAMIKNYWEKKQNKWISSQIKYEVYVLGQISTDTYDKVTNEVYISN